MQNLSYRKLYFLYFFIISITFSSLVFSDFAFLDDYDSLFYSLSNSGSTFQWDIFSGRPIYAILRDFSQQFISGIDSFSYIRLFTIITIVLYCIFLNIFFTKKNIFKNKIYNNVLPILLVLNPSIVVYASWATCYPFVIALILAGSAYQIIGLDIRLVYKLILSLFVLSCSFAIYQPAALTFLYFVFIDNCLDEKKIAYRKIFISFFILLSGMIVAYLMAKILPLMIYGEVLSRAEMLTDIMGKLKWFISEALINSINNFNISPNIYYSIFSLLVIIIGMYQVFPRKQKWLKIFLSLILFVGTYASNLLVSENWAAFRSMIGMELFVITFFSIGIFSCLSRMVETRSYYLLPLLFIIFVTQYNIFYGFIRQQQGEYQSMAQEITSRVPKDFTGKVYFDITDPAFSVYTKTQRYDEFGNISSATSWAPAGMALSIKHTKGYNFSVDKVTTPKEDIKCNNCIIIKLSDSMRKSGMYY